MVEYTLNALGADPVTGTALPDKKTGAGYVLISPCCIRWHLAVRFFQVDSFHGFCEV
jgi:hypothetical protein